jgi:hypothetical protein
MRDSSIHGVALIAGRYELLGQLREDQAHVEWEAFDTTLQRRVVVHLLPQALADDPAALERFWQSARAAARTSDVSGQRTLDGGTDPETGRAFVVREWPVAPPARSAGRPTVAPRPRHAPKRLLAGGAMLLAVVLVAVAGSRVQAWLGSFGAARFPAPTESTATLAPTAAPTATVAVAKNPTPTPAAPRATQAPTPQRGVPRRVVNTDGQGVALRASPGGPRLPGKGYDEGVTVLAFESSGEWTHVRGSDGREGWVLSVTLAP